MELRNLQTFVRAAELKSFSQAARDMGYSQSAVSMQIGQLEAELGAELFERVGRTVALTPQGMTLLSYAQNILRMADSARAELTRTAAMSGHLRIAMAASIGSSVFPDILARYHAAWPDVTMTLTTGTTDEMFRALSQNDVDMIYHLDRRIVRGDLEVPMTRPAPIIFVAPRGHALAAEKQVPLSVLVRQPFILTEKGMSYRYELDTHLAELGYEIDPCLEIGNTDVVADLVARGVGLSFLPEYVVRGRLASGSVVRLNVPEVDITLYQQLIYHRGKWITPAMQAMIDLIEREAAGGDA